METFTRKPHFLDLDGMRGLLACLVMLLHYGLDTIVSKLTLGLISSGEWRLCVDFFFLLSGFVLANSFHQEKPSTALYFVKRFRRLAPAFLLTTFWVISLPIHHESAFLIVTNLAIIQSLLNMSSINGPGWSVPFELFLPAIVLFTWEMLERIPKVMVAVCIVLGGIGCFQLALGLDLPWLRAVAGIFGGFSLYNVRSVIPQLKRPTPLTLGLFTSCIAIMTLAHKLPWLALAFTPAAMLTVLVGAQSSSVLSTWPLQALGRWSYAIYLVHVPMLLTAEVLFGQSRVDGSIPAKSALIILTFMLSAALYRFVERPLMWRHKPEALQTAP